MNDFFRLDQKVAVVVGGGAGGIGGAMARGLAQYGAKVVVADKNQNGAEQVANDIQSVFKSRAEAIQSDITDENSIVQMAESVVADFGTVDILVNSQGVSTKRMADAFPSNDWNFIFDINVKGMMITCREFGKVMIERRCGRIINLSSIRGVRGTLWGGNIGYCASKGAVDMLTRSLAAEWAQYNINVNAIAPGRVVTQMTEKADKATPANYQVFINNTPYHRLAQPDEMAGACVFLASPASNFITGQIFYLDGGLSAVVWRDCLNKIALSFISTPVITVRLVTKQNDHCVAEAKSLFKLVNHVLSRPLPIRNTKNRAFAQKCG
jgi:NAD(P)-dependent dehydrogenase (short-subunit alcohol dehydrogenase family)